MNEELKKCLEELLSSYKQERKQLDEKIISIEKVLGLVKGTWKSVPKIKRIRHKWGENCKRIERFFEENSGISIHTKELSKRTLIPYTSTERALHQLAAKGFLEKNENRQWQKKNK